MRASDGRISRMGSRYVPPARYNYTYKPIPRKEVRIVSQTIWCDIDDPETNAFGQLGHSFSSKDEAKKNYVERTTEKDKYGDLVVKINEIDICGYHANGLFQPKKSPASVQAKAEE